MGGWWPKICKVGVHLGNPVLGLVVSSDPFQCMISVTPQYYYHCLPISKDKNVWLIAIIGWGSVGEIAFLGCHFCVGFSCGICVLALVVPR